MAKSARPNRLERLPKVWYNLGIALCLGIIAACVIGCALTVLPVLIMGIIAFRWMKIDFGSVAGMLCGSMANPMALNYVNDTIPGDNPSVSYATVYPLCMFLRVIIAQVLLMFFLS